ncbi:hypothetical protein Ae201684P_006674 [Aphanomyces euteiches]|uniref:Glucose-methanol-choline oxidoreductase N-terminal domain-containing protein n=1 Tax=Aphanomyces euteiches TaxID=100861 RepID=A0A6G0WVG5_9STRA|nr:hypothetical protein Ae201684_011268 [Aphanomyces euteiches]KAH9100477.1 hypothetical protein Ae201684P_006674 [Aphanomyces euteiches]KAH9138573.1 hypothetical protein AeRB84_017125 [Aphanomyces euteiches]
MISEETPLLPRLKIQRSLWPRSWHAALLLCIIVLVCISLNGNSSPMQFDVIVIGGGPAGSVVASKLIELTNLSVLLIEAGEATQKSLGGTHFININSQSMPYTPFDVPFYWNHVAHMETFHWNVPNTFLAKALGGCGIHNAMLYVRALREDIETWNMKPTWTWETANDIYLATEAFDGPKGLDFHGYNGRVQTTRPELTEPLSQAFLDGCKQLGFPTSSDFNAPGERLGAGWYHFNIRNGVRDSAAATFLQPLLENRPPNFQLALNSMVEKINIDEATGRAVSVNVRLSTGKSTTIEANRAIVLTAGAVHTPKLLTLSGIASKDVLANLDIPVVADLPLVGNNLQDHPVIAMTFQATSPLNINLTAAWEQYIASKNGRLSTTGLAAGAFLTTPGGTSPELQLTFFPRLSEPQWSTEAPENQILITIALLAPEARNRVVVVSNQIDTPVIITPEIPQATNEHLTPLDAHKLVHGIRVVREIAATLALSQFAGAEIMPGLKVTSTDDLIEWIYATAYRNSHWVGTAKMGTSPSNGVVNQRLQVMNVSNLYVADASVIPIIPNGNVHSTVVMVASNAAKILADDLKDD